MPVAVRVRFAEIRRDLIVQSGNVHGIKPRSGVQPPDLGHPAHWLLRGGFGDDAAGDAVAGVACRVGHHIVGLGVDHD